MDLAAKLAELHKRTLEHREVLLTEEAAKTALVMPFIQALGYDIFNPGEVIPEFTADVGIKKGEKVDYAICKDGKVTILVECKPASVELSINHASQLFRYFSVTEARLAILTNGVVYKFFSDIERPNKMDDKPFFTLTMDAVRPTDIKIIEMPSQIIRQLEFNNSKPDSPVADPKVREAIAHAIDYDGLLSGVFDGTAERVYGPLTSNSWAFDPKVKDLSPKYDPELSKKLLAEAGYKPGDLNLKLYSFQGSLWGDVATFVQANLAAVGVNVEIAQTEFPSYRALHVAGDWDIALDGRQPWYNDPDAHITIGYLSSLRDTAMTFRMPENQSLDALILKAQQDPDMDARKELYYEIQDDLVKEVPAAYLFSPKLIVFTRANVDGLVINSAPPLTEYWSVSKE